MRKTIIMVPEIIKAGTILDIEIDSHSNLEHYGPYKVLKDIDKAPVVAEFRKQPARGSIHAMIGWKTPGDFLNWLIEEKYIELDTTAVNWHLGYDVFEPE